MKLRILLTGMLLVLPVIPVHAGDPAVGKSLVDSNCTNCHGTDVYTRKDRKVGSFPQLQTQVRRCELALGLKWFEEDINNAATYLDKEFYKFQ